MGNCSELFAFFLSLSLDFEAPALLATLDCDALQLAIVTASRVAITKDNFFIIKFVF